MIFSLLPSLARATAYWGVAHFFLNSEDARRRVQRMLIGAALIIGAIISIVLAGSAALVAFFLGLFGYHDMITPSLLAAGGCLAAGIIVGIEGLRLFKT